MRLIVTAAVAAPVAALLGGCGASAPSPLHSRPQNTAPPVVLGIAQVGHRLRVSNGSWSPKPTSYGYTWMRCDPSGSRCKTIAAMKGSTYALGRADLGATVRVSVVASDPAGESRAVLSASTAAITGSGSTLHLEYVFNDGPVNVYDIDHSFKLVESFTLPGTDRGVRGVAVAPATHVMFVSFGGDGGDNGNGSVLAYDLVAKRVIWSVNLHTGVDSGAVSNDGKLLYMPDGENSSDGNWYILDTADGSVVGKISTAGSGPHDGVMSADGKILQLGNRNYPRLFYYSTASGRLKGETSQLQGGVRPNTIDGADSVSFTTATGLDGFQVESVANGSVQYTVNFHGSCSFTTCSHGISLSPSSKEVAVIDAAHKSVQFWDVHGVGAGVAPAHIASVPVAGLEGEESGCAYDCSRDG